MQTALTYMVSFISSFIGFMFDDFKISNTTNYADATFGWFVVVLIAFSLIVYSGLARPRRS